MSDNNNATTINYKELYEREVKKNEELTEQLVAAEAEAAAPQAEKSYAENPTVSTVRPKENPTQARSAESRQSEPISASSRTSAKVTFEDTRDKPSVRRELAEIRAAHAERTETGRDSRQISPKGKSPKHKPTKHKKSKGR